MKATKYCSQCGQNIIDKPKTVIGGSVYCKECVWTDKEVVITYWEIDNPGELLVSEALSGPDESKKAKHEFLTRKQVPVYSQDETPLQRWIHWNSEKNNIPFSLPAHRQISDALQGAALKFVFALA